MADVYFFVYYECLQEFQRSIITEITQTDFNVDRLTEKAKKRGLIPAVGHYTRPESGKLVASRERKVVTLVSRCIESVKVNEDLFQSFLSLLDDAGLQHLVRRIRRRLSELSGMKPKRRAKVPPPTDDSAISISVSSTSQPPPPLPPIPTTFPSLQSPTHNMGAFKQPDRKMLRSATKQHSKSSFDYEAEKEPLQQPLTSPTHSSMGSIAPVEETQVNTMENLVASNTQPRILPSEDSKNTSFEKQQTKAESIILETQTHQMIALEKKLQEKNEQIRSLQKQVESLQKEMCKDKETLESLRVKIAELERELEKRDKDNENLRKVSSEHEQQVQILEQEIEILEQKIENLKKRLSEKEEKAEKQENQIKDLNNQILQKKVEKLKILDEYKDRERTVERERDTVKVELERLKKEMIEKEYKEEKKIRKKVEAENVILQQEKEEEERRRKAAEKGHRESLAELQESQAEINELKEKLNLNNT